MVEVTRCIGCGGPTGLLDIVCPKCESIEKVYCHACSEAGGADRPIYHIPPACSEAADFAEEDFEIWR